MSCMIQKHKNTAAIAEYVARILNTDYEVNGITCPRLLAGTLVDLGCFVRGFYDEKRIYNKLAALNAAAYNGRYPDENEVYIPEYSPQCISKNTEYNEHFIVREWHYKIFKMIQFFNYQCGEDATDKSDLLNGMRQLEDALARYIVENSDIYAALAWE